MRPRSNIKLNPEDLAKATDLTLDYYNRYAEDFWEGTRNHQPEHRSDVAIHPG